MAEENQTQNEVRVTYIYVMCEDAAESYLHGPVKIGLAQHLGRRLMGHQVSNHKKMVMAFAVPIPKGLPPERVESRVINSMCAKNISGEWVSVGVMEAAKAIERIILIEMSSSCPKEVSINYANDQIRHHPLSEIKSL